MKGGEGKLNKRICFEKFIEKEIDNAYRFAYTYMRSRTEAEDVVNTSVVKALSALGSLRSESAVKCWFYKIIANTAMTELKRNSRCVAVCEEEMPDLSCEDDYSAMNFESMIKALPEDMKAIVVMRFCDGLTFSEAARVLEMNENTVKTKFYAAMKRLRSEAAEGEE